MRLAFATAVAIAEDPDIQDRLNESINKKIGAKKMVLSAKERKTNTQKKTAAKRARRRNRRR